MGVDSDMESDNKDSKSSPVTSVQTSTAGMVHVLPIESNMFHHAFTPEEHFMINLCNVCDEANTPLDLVDKVVAVIRDTQNNGLNFESNIVCSREYFYNI